VISYWTGLAVWTPSGTLTRCHVLINVLIRARRSRDLERSHICGAGTARGAARSRGGPDHHSEPGANDLHRTLPAVARARPPLPIASSRPPRTRRQVSRHQVQDGSGRAGARTPARRCPAATAVTRRRARPGSEGAAREATRGPADSWSPSDRRLRLAVSASVLQRRSSTRRPLLMAQATSVPRRKFGE